MTFWPRKYLTEDSVLGAIGLYVLTLYAFLLMAIYHECKGFKPDVNRNATYDGKTEYAIYCRGWEDRAKGEKDVWKAWMKYLYSKETK